MGKESNLIAHCNICRGSEAGLRSTVDQINVGTHELLALGRFRLQQGSAPVGQEFQPKPRLFEATVGGQQDGKNKYLKKCLKLEFSRDQVSCAHVRGCPRNLTSTTLP